MNQLGLPCARKIPPAPVVQAPSVSPPLCVVAVPASCPASARWMHSCVCPLQVSSCYVRRTRSQTRWPCFCWRSATGRRRTGAASSVQQTLPFRSSKSDGSSTKRDNLQRSGAAKIAEMMRRAEAEDTTLRITWVNTGNYCYINSLVAATTARHSFSATNPGCSSPGMGQVASQHDVVEFM